MEKTPTSHTHQRRALTKGSLLAAAWSTPVIQSVFLSAHAQTSTSIPPPPPATPVAITFPGFSIDYCNLNDTTIFNSYAIDDTAVDTPAFITGNSFSIRTFETQTPNQACGITVEINGMSFIAFAQEFSPSPTTCPNSPLAAINDPMIVGTVTGTTNSTIYAVSGTLSVNESTVTVSDIVFTPQ